jgi:hypothetical protein
MKIHNENKDEESNTCVLLRKPDKKICGNLLRHAWGRFQGVVWLKRTISWASSSDAMFDVFQSDML